MLKILFKRRTQQLWYIELHLYQFVKGLVYIFRGASFARSLQTRNDQ